MGSEATEIRQWLRTLLLILKPSNFINLRFGYPFRAAAGFQVPHCRPFGRHQSYFRRCFCSSQLFFINFTDPQCDRCVFCPLAQTSVDGADGLPSPARFLLSSRFVHLVIASLVPPGGFYRVGLHTISLNGATGSVPLMLKICMALVLLAMCP